MVCALGTRDRLPPGERAGNSRRPKKRRRGRSPGPFLTSALRVPYAFLWQSAHFCGPLPSFLWHSWQVAWALSLLTVLLKPSIAPPFSSLWHCVHFTDACLAWLKVTGPGF